MFKKLVKLLLISLVAGLILPTPVATVTAQDGEQTHYWPTDGWRTATPESQGMDSDALADLMEDYVADDGGLQSLMVVRNGYVVLDAYVYPFEPGRRHELFSVTKSITSTMIGVAIQQGYIKSVDQTVIDLLGDLAPPGIDEAHAALTLEQMLMMGSGIDCPGDEGNNPNVSARVFMEGDRYEDLLLEPFVGEPGQRFHYCNPVSNLLSLIVTQTTGRNALDLGKQFVFGPLGIQPPLWSSNTRGSSHGFAHLFMTPHDMAKIGYLYLNDGEWDGEQIIPASYVRAATSWQIDTPNPFGYGYQWWVMNKDVAFAWGFAGQHIIINRKLNLIVVTTARNSLVFTPSYHNLLSRVFAAVQSDEPLPENAEGVARLASAVSTLANPITIEGDLLAAIDGQSLELPDNDLTWTTVRVSVSDDPDVFLVSVDGSADVPVRMTITGEVVNSADAEWLPGNGDLILSGEWSASDTLHITAQPLVPPGGFQVWLTFDGEGVASMLTFGR